MNAPTCHTLGARGFARDLIETTYDKPCCARSCSHVDVSHERTTRVLHVSRRPHFFVRDRNTTHSFERWMMPCIASIFVLMALHERQPPRVTARDGRPRDLRDRTLRALHEEMNWEGAPTQDMRCDRTSIRVFAILYIQCLTASSDATVDDEGSFVLPSIHMIFAMVS